MTMIRKSIYSGTWYPNEKRIIQSYINTNQKKYKAIGAVCPHAGWIYSGKVAGEVYSSIEPVSHYILIGPNHYGLGPDISIFPEGEWETPLGNLIIDKKIVDKLISMGIGEGDVLAHYREHSLEVQMPFIKYFSPNALIVPICLSDYRLETCKRLGMAISKIIKEENLIKNSLIIASSDMSHYIPADEAKRLDFMAIKKMLDIDPEGLINVVKKNNISMCGLGPVSVVLFASKDLGAQTSQLIRYSNSGEITHDKEEVVGYAGLIIL